MAVTFIVSPCKKGYGVYVRALSGLALKELGYKLAELSPTDLENASGIPVFSDRLTRKGTKEGAENVIKRLSYLAEIEVIEIIRRLFLRPITKNYKLAKLQYYRLHWDYKGTDISPLTTQNKAHIESLAVAYSEQNSKSKLVKTVARTVKVNPETYTKVVERGELLPAIPQGEFKGMCAPIKDQTATFTRRSKQKRKSTTTNRFWSKYR
jgi:hypothetical protein